MRTAQRISTTRNVTTHAAFLANVSRHFVSLEIEPMIEAVGRSSLGVLGDVCAVDRISEALPTRILEVRTSPETWLETPAELASTVRGEVSVDGDRSRISVPIGTRRNRFGVLSFAKNDGLAHTAADLALAQELGDRLSLAIRNAREHMSMAAALGDRERLISIAAHELRNPLCSVRFCLQALERNGGGLAPQAVRMLEIMSRGERKIARLIDDLLDLGRIRTGQLALDLSPVDLCDVIRDVSTLMEAQTADTGSTLNVELNGPVVGRWDRGPTRSGGLEPAGQRSQVRTGSPGVDPGGRRPAAQRGLDGGQRSGSGDRARPPREHLRTVQARDADRSARRSGTRSLHRPRDRRTAGRRRPRGQSSRVGCDVCRGASSPDRLLTPSLLRGDSKADPQSVCTGNS